MGRYDYLNEPFKAASEAGTTVPDGNYEAQIEAVEIKKNKSGTGEHLRFEMLTVGGDYPGATLFTRSGLPSEDEDLAKVRQQLGFLKKTLKSCGLDIDSPDFDLGNLIDNRLSDLQDRVVSVSVTTKNGAQYPDININEFIRFSDDEGEPATAAAGAGAKTAAPKKDIFENE